MRSPPDPTALPALLGGAAVRPEGPPDWPPADEAVRDAVERALRDGSWGKYHGGNVERLEGRVAAWLGMAHAATCGSGTFAVEAALRALGVGAGDEVLLAGYDYPGNFLAVHALGARPVLVDVSPHNWNVDAGTLAAALQPGIKAVIVSHLHGGLVPMQEVTRLCQERGVGVIEDAAQAPGAVVQGRPAGTWGDVGVFSFGGSKLLSAGRGGVLVTARADLHQRARLVLGRGNNLVCPLSELQAAVLLPQLDALPARHAQRERAVAALRGLLAGLPGLRLFHNQAEGSPGYYKVGLQYDEDAFGLPRGRLVAAMRAEGIALDEGFRALHVGRSPRRWRAAGPLTEVCRAHTGAVVLHHPVLLGSDADLEQVALALRRIHAHAGRLRSDPSPQPPPRSGEGE
jgi:dTDP-4-amino-4,6-dideoxygalactose transaminase